MIEAEMAKKAFNIFLPILLDKLLSKGIDITRKNISSKKDTELLSTTIDEITKSVSNEEALNVVLSFIDVIPSEGKIFTDDLRNQLIDFFYNQHVGLSKSRSIDDSLNKYFDTFELTFDTDNSSGQKKIYRNSIKTNLGIDEIIKTLKDINDELKALPTNAKVNKTFINNRIYTSKLLYISEIDTNNNLFEEQYFIKVCHYAIDTFKNTWKKVVLEFLEYFKNENDESLKKKLSALKISISDKTDVETINAQLLDFINSAKINMSHELKDIAKELTEKSGKYHSVLLLTGEYGSGKTTQINKYVQTILDDCNQIILSVDENVKNINKGLCDQLNKLTDAQCDNLEIAISNLISLFPEKHITVIIDDLDELVNKRSLTILELIKTIKSLTSFDCINWILAVDDKEFYNVFSSNESRKFLLSYCMDSGVLSSKLFENSINMNELVEENHVINRLLCNSNITVSENDFGNIVLKNDVTGNPLLVSILCDVLKNTTIEKSELDTYPSFVKKVYQMTCERLELDANENGTDLFAIIATVLEVLKQDHSKSFMIKTDIGTNRLQALHLISQKKHICDDIWDKNYKTASILYTIQNEIFWAWRYFVSNHSNIEISIDSINDISQFYDKLKNIMMSCYIMYAENNDDTLNRLINLFIEEDMIDTCFYYARRSDIHFQKMLIEAASRKKTYTVNETNSVLSFAFYANTHPEIAITSLMLVNSQIDNYRFINFYANTLKRVLQGITNTSELLDTVSSITTCGNVRINMVSGDICAKKFDDLAKLEGSKGLWTKVAMIYNWLKDRKDVNKILTHDNHKSASFMDFFIKGIMFTEIKHSSSLSELFWEGNNKWFSKPSPYGLYFKRNFVASAGNVYQYALNKYKNEYYDLTLEMAMRNDKYEYMTAFSLIDNSKKFTDKFVNPLFEEAIDELLDKRQLQKKYLDRLKAWKMQMDT